MKQSDVRRRTDEILEEQSLGATKHLIAEAIELLKKTRSIKELTGTDIHILVDLNDRLLYLLDGTARRIVLGEIDIPLGVELAVATQELDKLYPKSTRAAIESRIASDFYDRVPNNEGRSLFQRDTAKLMADSGLNDTIAIAVNQWAWEEYHSSGYTDVLNAVVDMIEISRIILSSVKGGEQC